MSAIVPLIVRREIRARAATRPYQISTALLLVAALVVPVLVAVVLDDDDERPPIELGAVAASLDEATLAQAGAAIGREVELVAFDEVAELERAVSDGDVDAGLDGDTLVWHDDADDEIRAIVDLAAGRLRFAEAADELALDTDQLAALLTPEEIDERFVDPGDDDDAAAALVATLGVFVTFFTIQIYGSLVLMGVVEEKSSRVVEILLSQVRARHLLAGKVLGMGALALAQVAIIAAGVLASLLVTDTIDVSGRALSGVPLMVLWIGLGFVMYSMVYALAGSMVARQEDASSVSVPAALPLLLAYFVGFSVVDAPESTLARALSLFPPTAPIVAPIRQVRAEPPWWELPLSVGLMLVAVWGLLRLAGKVYETALLHTGSRLSVRRLVGLARG